MEREREERERERARERERVFIFITPYVTMHNILDLSRGPF